MLPLRQYLWRPPRLRLQTLRPRGRLRLQHNNHGPHKEYFQHPSQYPSNVQITPNTPDTPNPALPFVPQSALAQAATQVNQPGPLRRAIRNVSLILVFSLLGYATGAAVVTWEYIQPAYERGSEEYIELQEEIDEILEDAPICEHLRKDNWIEGPILRASAPGNAAPRRDQHLVNDTLSGVQGFTMKHFRHPSAELSMLVFFSGFGIDGWPDTVHGGALSTIMVEAHNKHLEPILKENHLDLVPCSESNFGFTQMVKPGTVYAVLVVSQHWGTGHVSDGNEDFIVNSANAFLYNMNEITVEKNVVQGVMGLPQEGMAIDMEGEQHAIAKLTVCMRSNKVVKKEGESREEHLKRLDDVAKAIAESPTGWPTR